MNSITDLNNIGATPVTFNTFRDYTIVFGNSAGNISTQVFENSYFLAAKQVQLETFDFAIRDLLIYYTFSDGTKINELRYVGNNPNIAVFSATANTWQATGIRTVNDYNDAFNNIYIGINADTAGNVVLCTIQPDDQAGNSQQWVQTANIVENTFIQLEPIVYDEDSDTSLASLQITDQYIDPTNYAIVATVDPLEGQFVFGNLQIANTWNITADKDTINQELQDLVFRPAADYVDAVDITFNIERTADELSQLVVSTLAVGNVHDDFARPTDIVFTGSFSSVLTGFEITDLRPDRIDANIQYSVNIGTDNANMVLSYDGNTVSQVTLTGTKSDVNAILGNVNLVPSVAAANLFTDAANITYTQTQTTDSRLQANISVPLLYQPQLLHSFSNVEKPLGNRAGTYPSQFPDNATSTTDVDFWGFEWNTEQNTLSGLANNLRYSQSRNDNTIDISRLRDTANFVSSPGSIRITGNKEFLSQGSRNTGIVSRVFEDPASIESPYSVGFYFYWDDSNPNKMETVIARIDGLTPAVVRRYTLYVNQIGSNSVLRMTDQWPARAADLPDIITFGPISKRTWNHVAFQKSAGPISTAVFSAWLNGQPVSNFTGYESGTQVVQNGSNWYGKTQQINRIYFGAGRLGAGASPYIFSTSVNEGWLDTETGVSIPFNGNIDEVEVLYDAPYQNLTPFTPGTPTVKPNTVVIMSGIPGA